MPEELWLIAATENPGHYQGRYALILLALMSQSCHDTPVLPTFMRLYVSNLVDEVLNDIE